MYFFQKNKGASVARNYGMSKANGSWFIFLDSDCILHKNWLKEIDNFIQINKVDAFGGADTALPGFPPLLKAIDYSMTSFIGTGGTRGSKNCVGKYYPRTYNMGIKREVYNKVGDFNNFKTGEDLDYSQRIHKNNFIIKFIPSAFVYHKRRTTITKFIRQIYTMGKTRIFLSQIDKELFKFVHFLPFYCILFSILLIILAFFNKIFLQILLVYFIANFFTMGIIFLQSWIKYKSVKVGFLSIITTYIQIAAYGFGFINALIQLKIKGKIIGFEKYEKNKE